MVELANSKNKFPATFEDAISLAGYGKFNLFVLLATGGCLMCVIIETMCSMFIIPAAQCDLNLSLFEKGLLYSISFFGVVSSSHLSGYIADTRGRKIVLLVSLISSAFVSFICSVIALPWLYITLRYVNGFLIGGSSAIVYAFAGEFHDNRYRPKVVTWIATFVALGNMYLPGLAWLLLPQDWSFEIPYFNILFRPWRLLVILYALPSIASAVLIYFLPESPKYLISRGKHEEVMVILTKMFCTNTGKDPGEYKVSSILWDETAGQVEHEKNENMFQSMWEQTAPLFKRSYLVKTILVCLLQFGIFFSTSSIVMWYPQILNGMTNYGKIVNPNEVTMCKSILYEENFAKSNLTDSSLQKTCNDEVNIEVFQVTMAMGAAYAACYIFSGTFINIIGKKNLLSGFVTLATVSGLCAQLLAGYTTVLITLAVFLMGGASIGIVNAVVVDLYPTQIRGMALAVSLMFGRFGAMAGSNVAGPLMYTYCDYMFYVFTADHIMVVIIVLLLPSTRFAPQKTEIKEVNGTS